MALIIPIKDNPNHTILIDIDSKIFKLYFKYNTRANFWSMDIYTEDDLILIYGVKIVANYPILFYHKNSAFPSGDFICEIADKSATIKRDSFSSGAAKLLFLTKDEIGQAI